MRYIKRRHNAIVFSRKLCQKNFAGLSDQETLIIIIIIIIFIYLPSDVISQEKKTATSSTSITKASKYAIPLKPNTQTCRVKAIFSHLVRKYRTGIYRRGNTLYIQSQYRREIS